MKGINRNNIESYIVIDNNLIGGYTRTLLRDTLFHKGCYAEENIWFYVPDGMQSDLPKLYIEIYKVFRW